MNVRDIRSSPQHAALLALSVDSAHAHRVRVDEAALLHLLGDLYRRYRHDVPALLATTMPR